MLDIVQSDTPVNCNQGHSSPERKTPAVSVNLDEMCRFLNLLDPDKDRFLFLSLDDDHDRDRQRRAKKIKGVPPIEKLAEPENILAWMNKRQTAGANICCTVQAMKGAKRNVSSVCAYRAIFAEMDGRQLKSWPIEPSIIVESSPGKSHVYWLIDPETPMDRETFEGIQTRLVLDYGADAGARDCARALRLAGTWNLKTGRPAHLVTITHEAGYRYAVDELVAAFPVPAKSKDCANTNAPRPDFSKFRKRGDLGRFIEPLKFIPSDNYFDWIPVGMALHQESNGGSGGLQMWDAWSAKSENWRPGECEYRWNTFHTGKGITGGKVFHIAEEFGYQKPEKPKTLSKRKKANVIYGEMAMTSNVATAPELVTDVVMKAATASCDEQEREYALPFSEENMALEFAKKYRSRLRFVKKWNAWMEWSGTHWRRDETLLTYNLIRKECRVAAAVAVSDEKTASYSIDLSKTKTRNAIDTLIRSDRFFAATTEQWDADDFLLGTPGGIIDLRKGKNIGFGSDNYITRITTITPDKKSSIAEWMKFLRRATKDNDEVIAYLKRLCGYILTGSTREHCLPFIFGPGGNGKGTFLNVLIGIMGELHKAADVSTFTEQKNPAHSTELARLHNARLVTCEETEKGAHWAEARLKKLTGGNVITARFMRCDDFEFTPKFKIVIVGNHKPKFRSVDEAIRRRLHLVPFDVIIPKEERDHQLGDKLKSEFPGILAWMIEGAAEWQERGLDAPETILTATNDYLDGEDTTGQWLANRCNLTPYGKTNLKDLFDSWKHFCELTNVKAVGTSKDLSTELEKRLGEGSKKTVRGVVRLTGIRLKTGDEIRADTALSDAG